MKNILTFLFLCSFTVSFGQLNNETYNSVDKWDEYTNPTTDNYFYHHFKKYLTPELILTEKFSKNKRKIIVEFNLVDGLIENIRTNTTNIFLKNKIIKAFNNLDFNEISIKKNSTFHNYSIQLIEKVNGKGILKCSSSVLHETPPICINCSNRKDFESYNQCFKKKLEKYLYSNIDSAKIANLEIDSNPVFIAFSSNTSSSESKENSYNNPIYIKINFDKEGKALISNNAKEQRLKDEITNILNGYNFENVVPATINDVQENYTYEFKTSKKRLIRSWLYKTSTDNDLAKYFKEEIPTQILNKELLNDKRNSVSISFSLNKKGRLEQVTSSAKSTVLDEHLITAFKNYPLEKLKIPKKIHILSKFSFTVIVSEDFKNRIECNNYLFSETYPIVKGCHKSKSSKDLKKCDQNAITNVVSSNFDISIAHNLNLKPGVKRIFVMFKISSTGEIIDVRAKGPHKKLTEEAIRVVKKIKIDSPAFQMGMPVGVKYSLPIAFKIGENKPKDPFKDMDKSINERRY